MRRFWAVTFGAPGDPGIGIMAAPKPEEREDSEGKIEHGGEQEEALCLFDSEEAARAFWQEAEESGLADRAAAQYGAKPVYFVPIPPHMLAEFVGTVGHPLVAVNPSLYATREGAFVPAEEFLESA